MTSAADAQRYTVKVPTIEPAIPAECDGCGAEPTQHRRLAFRRSDGSVERVSVVEWPYCNTCVTDLRGLDREQRWMTFLGGIQVLLVMYAVGGATGYYDFWYPSLLILGVFFFLFVHYAKRARALWGVEWARIDDVYKGGIGAAYSFRNRTYAEKFAAANAPE